MQHDSASRRDFHVSRGARDRYQFDESLYALTGEVIIANFHAARVIAQRMNQKRDLLAFPEQAVQASQINALGLIHELTHYVFKLYRDQRPNLMPDLQQALYDRLGQDLVDTTLRRFADEFPPLAVYRREQTRDQFLESVADGTPGRHIVLEELLLLYLSNSNPAFAPFLELFDDAALEKETGYLQVVEGMREFFGGQAMAGFAAQGQGGGLAGLLASQNLLDLLLAPARAVPHSLEGQLEYMRQHWGLLLGRYLYRVLSSLDLIKEENKPVFGGGFGGPVDIPIFARGQAEGEPENFTPDREWMPRLVMIAKNAYVWLDQLSREYGRPIDTLADIPDEELDRLAGYGITGLWLIGLWERSRASREIKQIMGNPDAVASAYSLYDYQIAAKLGGEAACGSLRERAWARGIRLASDMVPNHVGVDGRWVLQHPDWFVSLGYPPFPSYTFNGPDLSHDERVGIFLEDHYYSRSDAAVVFKRLDRHTGAEQYIYHGNDGTSMPWNDTAQLNYLRPEVREAVIQTILHVARQFPIIRFDAAMTLAKRHFQRLWFPEPGTGGDIASRAEFGLTKEQFEQAMPQEFWREVVDRCAAEAPDTLLLAEAFWLMESYFVRTLGMHRVYNSAFMHILRDEDNAKYRALMKNTLEFDPEILKRYVNFMNNPDERTAVDQFGKGDKYFGICTLLATMPGLPMFGHGQVEGFAEKYGMEYQRAYWDERPDQGLIERHEREIFPLLHRRYLFANVDRFLLYDFYTPEGGVNEDVFAYSNGHGAERALVVYHNRYATARGWVRSSAAFMARTGQGDERRLVQRTLGEGLGLDPRDGLFCIFRDHTGGLEFIRSNRELVEQGLYVELEAYRCHVFLDFRVVEDNAWGEYRELAAYLGGRGVPSVEEALREIFLQPVHRPLRALVNAELFRRLMDLRVRPALIPDDELDELEELAGLEGDLELVDTADEASAGSAAEELEELEELDADHGPGEADLIEEVADKTLAMLRALKEFSGGSGDEEALAQEIGDALQAILHLPLLEQPFPDEDAPGYAEATAFLREGTPDDPAQWGTLFGWTFVHALGRLVADEDVAQQSRSLIDEWMLGRVLQQALQELGLGEGEAAQRVLVIKQLTIHQSWFEDLDRAHTYALVEALLQDREVQQLLGVNRYQGVLWFSKDAFERLLWWMLLLAVVRLTADRSRTPREATQAIGACYAIVSDLRAAAESSGYQIEKLLENIPSEARVS